MYTFLALMMLPLFIYIVFLSLSENSGRLTWVRLQQPQEQRYPFLQVHVGSFCVSVIHRTLTWTTGHLTCVCGRSYACGYTHGGLGTPTTSQHNILNSEKLSQFLFLCSWRGSNLRSMDLESDALYTKPSHPDTLQVSHPSIITRRPNPSAPQLTKN